MSSEMMIFNNEEFGEIRVIGELDNPLFNLNDVGFALGYVRDNGTGKMYLYKSRIDKVLENGLISTCEHDGHRYITEDGLYDFILEARTENAKKFRKWVTKDILPTIRQTGGYVQDNREEEFVEKYFPSFSDEVKLGMVQDLMKKNKELKEKAEEHEQLMDSSGCLDFEETAKSCKFIFGRNKLIQKLREEGIILKGATTPYQTYIDRGYFIVIQTVLPNGYSAPQTLVTKKGLSWLSKKGKEWGIVKEIKEGVIF